MKSNLFYLAISITLASCAGSEESTGSVSDTTSLSTEADASTSEDSKESEDTYIEPEVTETIEPECTTNSDCVSEVACAVGFCFQNSCVFNANHAFCDDDNPCTVDSCNPYPETNEVLANGGCNVNKPAKPCEDNNACTDNLCDPEIGCVFPTNGEACDDANLCTDDYCNLDGNCEHIAVTIDDGDLNTLDGCTPEGGIYHTLIECSLDGAVGQCEDDDPCTNDWCESGKCQHEPINCDDDVACTDQLCMGGECVYIPNCESQDECSEGVCNLTSGSCDQVEKALIPSNVCVSVSCTPGIGKVEEKIEGCCQAADECVDGDPCTENFCDLALNTCEMVEKPCDDNIACTTNWCSLNGNCESEAHDELCLNSGGYPLEGNKQYCLPQGKNKGCVECIHGGQCDDGDPCTVDVCNYTLGNTCSHEPMECPGNHVCTVNKSGYPYCAEPEGWCTEGYHCPYVDACTERTCVDNACVYTPKVCDDDNLCTTETCHPDEGCNYTYLDCDDKNACTDDFCDPEIGACEHVKQSDFCIPCDEENGCEVQTICVENASISYSGACTYGSCHHNYINVCNDGNLCEDGYCSELDGKCHQTPKDCSDDDVCTTDFCDWNQGCKNESSLNCDDFNPCTFDSCDPDEGCINTWNFDSIEDGGCPAGPNSICDEIGTFNCKQCFITGDDDNAQCDDGIDETIDSCVISSKVDLSKPYVCVHDYEEATSSSGIVNHGSEQVRVDIKTNFGEWIFNVILEPGEYAGIGSQSFQIHNAKYENGDDIAVPVSLACVTYEGWEYKWTTEYDGGHPTCLYFYELGPSGIPMQP